MGNLLLHIYILLYIFLRKHHSVSENSWKSTTGDWSHQKKHPQWSLLPSQWAQNWASRISRNSVSEARLMSQSDFSKNLLDKILMIKYTLNGFDMRRSNKILYCLGGFEPGSSAQRADCLCHDCHIFLEFRHNKVLFLS